jgi:hypothetical protein
MPYVPNPDPLPIPAPPGLLHILLVFTFLLHVLFMNMALGGTLIATAGHLRDPRGNGARLARELSRWNTYGIAFTVTTGIAPLLFLQVLYGHLFYSAAILLGGFWLLAVGILTAAYYANFVYKLGRSTPSPLWIVTAAAGFLLVALALVAVTLLWMSPGEWPAVALDRARVLALPSLLPRFLHFVVGAVAVAGFLVVLFQVHRDRFGPGGDPAYRAWAARHGLAWARWATVVQVALGVWFLLALPRDTMRGIMGGSAYAMGSFAVGLALALLLLVLLFILRDPLRQRGRTQLTGAVMLLVVVAMVLLRDALRGLYLVPAADAARGVYSTRIFDPSDLAVRSQWGLFLLFVLFLLAALGTVWWVVRAVVREWNEGARGV